MKLLDAELVTARELGMSDLARRCGSLAETLKDRTVYPDDLTKHEVEVLQLLAAGPSTRAIPARLFISAHTAAAHIRSILAKTGAANCTDATAYAVR